MISASCTASSSRFAVIVLYPSAPSASPSFSAPSRRWFQMVMESIGRWRGVSAGQKRRQSARADYQQLPRIFSSQVARRERRCRRGSPCRKSKTVKQRQRLAGPARLQHVDSLHRRQPQLSVVRKYIDDLDAEKFARRHPGRHQQLGRLFASGQADGVMVAARRNKNPAEGVGERVDEQRKCQARVDFRRREEAHKSPIPGPRRAEPALLRPEARWPVGSLATSRSPPVTLARRAYADLGRTKPQVRRRIRRS